MYNILPTASVKKKDKEGLSWRQTLNPGGFFICGIRTLTHTNHIHYSELFWICSEEYTPEQHMARLQNHSQQVNVKQEMRAAAKYC